MRTPLEKSVLDAIRAGKLMSAGDRVGVAVSGGGDSLALLLLLEKLRPDLGITLIAIHFDHGLRGAESEMDAQFVADLARAHELECIVGREDVSAAAVRNGWNLEDAGRRLRYAFFQSVVQQGRATRIAVAHTLDDQAETVLAHLLRGTGPAGLAGIYPIVDSIVRPLLTICRKDLREYLRDAGQPWREDPTNLDVSRQRAKIREQLLPLLARDFSPQVAGHLAELARFSREEEQFWQSLVEDRIRTLVRFTEEGLVIGINDLISPLPLPSFNSSEHSQHLRPLTQRLIRTLYKSLRGDLSGLGFAHVEQVIRLAIESTSGHRAQLPGGVHVERRFDELIFSRVRHIGHTSKTSETAALPNAYQYVVHLPGRGTASVSVPELGTRFCLKVIDWPFAASETNQVSEALDADLLRSPLILRSWRPGDAYRPRGRRQTRKLKQMFLAARVPTGERLRWPVLECAGRVIWSRGMPAAEEFSAREGTRAGLVIEEDRL